MISVLLPVYNRVEMMKDAIYSFTIQKGDYELIVVDDGSSEDVESVVKGYIEKDDRISFYRNSENMGQAFTLNKAMRLSKGDIICQVHTDDMLANVLHKRQEWHDRTGAEVIYTDFGKMFIDGLAWYPEKPEVSAPINIINKEHINFLTLSWKRSILDRVGFFDEDYRAYFDWDWKIRLAMECSVAYVPEISVFYRVHSGQLSVACREDGTNVIEYKLMREKMKQRYGGLF